MCKYFIKIIYDIIYTIRIRAFDLMNKFNMCSEGNV